MMRGSPRLVRAAQAGDQQAFEQLMREYRGMVYKLASNYYLKGAERVDLQQEGYIGLWKAVRDYDASRSKFDTFAEVCVLRQIITAVKAADRRKHQYLNEAVIVKGTLRDDVDDILETLTDYRSCSAEEVYLANARSEDICSGLARKLSPFEADVFKLIYNGRTYLITADQLGTTPKAVDNALQRVRRKYAQQAALTN